MKYALVWLIPQVVWKFFLISSCWCVRFCWREDFIQVSSEIVIKWKILSSYIEQIEKSVKSKQSKHIPWKKYFFYWIFQMLFLELSEFYNILTGIDKWALSSQKNPTRWNLIGKRSENKFLSFMKIDSEILTLNLSRCWCVNYVPSQVRLCHAKTYSTGGRCAAAFGWCSSWRCWATAPSSSCWSSPAQRWTCRASSSVTSAWPTFSWASTWASWLSSTPRRSASSACTPFRGNSPPVAR